MFVSTSERGFMDTFKEASAIAHRLAAAQEHSSSELIREIAKTHSGAPFGMTASPAEIRQGTIETLQAAIAALEAKAPGDVADYRAFVLDVAQSVAEAAKGTSEAEAEAIETIRGALGAGAA
jgi:hypothetical protein